MDSLLTTFIIACSSALAWHNLPSVTGVSFILLSSIVAAGYGVRYTQHRGIANLVSVSFLGIAWMASVGHWNTRLQLPPHYYQQTLIVEGVVDSLQHEANTKQFDLKLNQIGKLTYQWFQPRIKLSWYDSAWSLKQGQAVRLVVKIKQPHGFANQHGFHVEKWLFEKNVIATGYVKPHPDNRLIRFAPSLRQYALDKIQYFQLQNESWILALALGFREGLSDQDWTVLQQTGTAHLIAISGLHVGLVAVSAYSVFTVLFFLFNVSLHRQNNINQHRSALIMSWFAALGYAWLAGFSVSTIRAMFMFSLVLLSHALLAHWHVRRLILLGMAGLIIISPLSIFSLGYWLSFSAVSFIAFLVWYLQPLSPHPTFREKVMYAAKLQCLLSLLMIPLVAWQMNMVSISSSVANLVAIPLMSFFLLPLTLVSTLAALLDVSMAAPLFEGLDISFTYFIGMLERISSLSWGAFTFSPVSGAAWLFLLLLCVVKAMPTWPMSRAVLAVVSLPLILALVSLPKVEGRTWQVDVLDVGQGLSVVMRKGTKAIIYDVAMAYPSGYSVADSVILPFLKGEGIKHISPLIISHDDMDHSGGKPAILKAFPETPVLDTNNGCVAGNEWQWMGAKIAVLWPTIKVLEQAKAHQNWSDNDLSCVIKVDFGTHSIMLPGDIEKSAESALLDHYHKSPTALHADVLIAPHHGSKTSSSSAFIDAVSPDVVVFSQGYGNRWGMPHESVLARYQRRHITTYLTSDEGQVNIIYENGLILNTFRRDVYPYWYANKQ